MSKNAINALTREQQRLMKLEGKNILICAVNPGDVATDMNEIGSITPDEGIKVFFSVF